MQDWIVIALTHYNEELLATIKRNARAKGETVGDVSIDVSFSKAENLAILPKCVLGLLKSPLLNVTVESSPDYWTYLETLYTSLDPYSLRLALYPALYGIDSQDSIAKQELHLSISDVKSNNSRIFVYNSYHLIYVFYAQSAADLPFPPPKTCSLRQMLQEMKQNRQTTPQQTIVRFNEPKDAESYFESLLIEDRSNNSKIDYPSLQESWESSVTKYIGTNV